MLRVDQIGTEEQAAIEPVGSSESAGGLFKLDRIKHRIVLVALLATLIPSVGTAWMSYVQNKRALTEKLTQELQAVSSQSSRELSIWIAARIYDLKVYRVSDEVAGNLERLPSFRGETFEGVQAYMRMTEYLRSVRERSPGFQEMFVVDSLGSALASSADSVSQVDLPEDWRDRIRTDQILGQPYWDNSLGKPSVMIADSINSSTGDFLGALIAKLDFDWVDSTLASYTPGDSGETYLIVGDRMVTSSRASSGGLMRTTLPPRAVDALDDQTESPVEYVSYRGYPVFGTSRPVESARWAVVAEIPRAEAFAAVTRLRNTTIVAVSLLLVVVGVVAYRVGVIIGRPLDRLTEAVEQVAEGDFTVDLPVMGGGEVGDLTEVFNDMVERLRHGREELDEANEILQKKNAELERLSITDGLTGLYNRRQLMEVLEMEGQRTRRHHRPFTLLMLDVDQFKKLNDTYGHLAGDEVLKRLATILHEEIREIDIAARYGGEEFLVMLPDTDIAGGTEVAERIRSRLEQERFSSNGDEMSITVSIGVADCPEEGESAEAVIAKADDALYKAKRRGRNRVVRFDGKRVTRNEVAEA